ncbi:MAG: glycosyltransferase [Rhodocyclaceae bacterium]|nr:MAG: glycosyltransferase [Rhodocyclaceae bacterium]
MEAPAFRQLGSSAEGFCLYNSGETWMDQHQHHRIQWLHESKLIYDELTVRYHNKDQYRSDHGIEFLEEEIKQVKIYKAIAVPSSLPKVVVKPLQVEVPIKKTEPKYNGTVSVVIGHRGTERIWHVQRTIESLRKQTTPVQIILVEQDAFPVARSALEGLVDKYLFCYSDQPYNRSWAFNCGVKIAETELILLHDGDLLVPEDYLAYAATKALKCNIFQPWYKIVYLDEMSSQLFPLGPLAKERAVTNAGIHGGSTLIHRSWYLQVGGMDERFWGWGAEDDSFYEKCRRLGRYVKADGKGPTLHHLYHSRSKSARSEWMKNRRIWATYLSARPQQLLAMAKHTVIGDPDMRKRNTIIKPVSTLEVKSSNILPRKVHIIYDVEGWAYYHRAKALQNLAPPGWEVSIGRDLPKDFRSNPPGIVLLLNYGAVDYVSARVRHESPSILVGGLNVGWPRRLDHFEKLRKSCHYVLLNNKEYWDKAGRLPQTYAISNGVDGKIFKSLTPLMDRPDKVLWVGSIYHADLKGMGKGKNNILGPLAKMLANKGIESDFRLIDSLGKKKLSQVQMNEWYNTGRIYVVASESEGTPNPLLESSLCGLVPVSTRVGNAPELIQHMQNGWLTEERSPEALLEGILYVRENLKSMSEAMADSIVSWEWEKRSKDYFNWFESLLTVEV